MAVMLRRIRRGRQRLVATQFRTFRCRHPLRLRHTGLDPVSIWPLHSVLDRAEAQAWGKVAPIGVDRFDQGDLSVTLPVFQLFFARDRSTDVAEHPVMDQSLGLVGVGKAGVRVASMLCEATE